MPIINHIKGTVRAFPQAYSGDGKITLGYDGYGSDVRSFTVINLGTATAFLWGIKVPLVQNASIVLGGYDDSNRDDDILLEFAAVGTKTLVVIADIQKEKPEWTILKK